MDRFTEDVEFMEKFDDLMHELEGKRLYEIIFYGDTVGEICDLVRTKPARAARNLIDWIGGAGDPEEWILKGFPDVPEKQTLLRHMHQEIEKFRPKS